MRLDRSGIRPGEGVALAAIVAVAAALRLSRLDLIEFKADEAAAIAFATPMITGGAWPEVGLVSSVHINNPPLFIYLTALPMWLSASTNPLFVTGSLVGGLAVLGVLLTFAVIRPRFGAFAALSAAALFACSPWAAIYSRKLWAQDVLPVFLVALLHVLFVVCERRRTWLIAFVPVLFGVIWQMHFSALALVPVCAAVVVLRARDISWPDLATGAAIAVAMLFPYLHFQATHDWTDVRTFGQLAFGSHATGGTPPPQNQPFFVAVSDTFQVSGGTRFDFALGRSTGAYEATRGAWANAARAAGTPVAWALTAAGLLIALVRGLSGVKWRRGWPPVEPASEGWPYLIVFGWITGIWLFYVGAQLNPMYRHYLIVAYPVPFVLAALAAREPALWLGKAGYFGGAALVGLVLAAHVESFSSFERFLDRTGGTAGDYGVVFRHKADLARFAVRKGLSIRQAPGSEYEQLRVDARRFRALGALQPEESTGLPGALARLDVYDTLLNQSSRTMRCPGRVDFGPLVACPVP